MLVAFVAFQPVPVFPDLSGLNVALFGEIDDSEVTDRGGNVVESSYEDLMANINSGNIDLIAFDFTNESVLMQLDGAFDRGPALQGEPEIYFDGEIAPATSGDDFVIGTVFKDVIALKGGDDFFYGSNGNDEAYGNGGYDDLDGGKGKDKLYGGGGGDHIYGGEDNDRLFGGNGEDYLSGGRGEDIIKGEGGADILHGDGNADRLAGADGWDYLYGGNGNDMLHGGRGRDHLEGGMGADLLTGGSGKDTFVFRTDEDTRVDTITDFNVDQDRVIFYAQSSGSATAFDRGDDLILRMRPDAQQDEKYDVRLEGLAGTDLSEITFDIF